MRTMARMALVILLAGLLAACGGGGGATPTPTAITATPTKGPTPNPVEPATAVAVFASPAGTNTALAAIAARSDVPLVLLAGSSRDPASFDGVTVPDGVTVEGTQPVSTARDSSDFDAAYADRTGEQPPDIARQAYDSVYVAALAAIGVNTTDGKALTDAVRFVANPPGEVVRPNDFGHAAELLGDGDDIDYLGISGFVDMTSDDEVSKDSVDVWRLAGADTVDVQTRDVDLAAEAGAQVPGGSLLRSQDTPAPLVIGIEAEAEQEAGDPTWAAGAGAAIAVTEINGSGGVFGQPIEIVSEAPGAGAAQALLDDGANVIIGPADIELAVDAAQAAAGASVPVFAFTDDPTTKGGFFRLAPSQTLQTAVLANLALEAGAPSVCVLAEGDVGQAMASAFGSTLAYKNGLARKTETFAAGDDLTAPLEECLKG